MDSLLRKNIFYCLICILPIVTSKLSFSQDIQEKILEDQKTENVLILEHLEYMKTNPLNINTASEKIIADMPFFDDISAHKIVSERKKNGDFVSVHDFTNRMHFDHEFVNSISSYIKFSTKIASNPVTILFRSRCIQKLEQAKGFKNNKYKGSPLYTYNRISVKSSKFKSKLLIHKDPGESSFADLFTGYVEIYLKNHNMRIIAGDFTVEAGQGLSVWSQYSQYKGANSIQAAKNRASDLSGYCSSSEFGFFRGYAITFKKSLLSLIGFYSFLKKDAVLNSDSTVSSFKETGFHRTESEIGSKMNAEEIAAGVTASLKKDNSSIGMTALKYIFHPKIFPEKSEKKFFEFRGTELLTYSLYWNIWLNQFNLYGEVSFSDPGSTALVSGIIASVNRTKFSFVFYHFSRDYYNPHSSFMSLSPAKNRIGFYSGIKQRFSKKVSFSFYGDIRKTPWRTYSIPMPFTESDIFTEWEIKLSKKSKLLFRIRNKTGVKTISNSYPADSPKYIAQASILKFRSEASFVLSKKVKLRLRLESSKYAVKNQQELTLSSKHGILFFTDISLKPRTKTLINIRFIKFDTPSYDTRIYEFERDLPGIFSNIALYDKGEKMYTVMSLNISNHLKFSAKWSFTIYHGKTCLFSGNDMINGNSVNKVGIQGDINF